MELGFENRKKAMIAGGLGLVAVLVLAFQVFPLIWGGGTPVAASQPPANAPAPRAATARKDTTAGKKKPRAESLDPTLQLQLLASAEQTQYSGTGRNIFVAQAEEVRIQNPMSNGSTDHAKVEPPPYHIPDPPQATPIPLKFFGFASRPGEPKKIFLSQGEDVWVAGEGEIVNRRYKVVRISPTSVEMQDVLNSGPSQMIPLTQG